MQSIAATPIRQRIRNANHRLGLYRVYSGYVGVRDKVAFRVRPRIGHLNHHDPKKLAIPPRYHQQDWDRERDPELPSISIVTPSFNQAEFIERTVRSVTEQRYPDIEYMVEDGLSTDSTMKVLEGLTWDITSVVSEADHGQAHAIDKGFQRTSGEIMGWINSDDLLLPGSLRYVGKYFLDHPEIDVLYGHRVLIDEQDREVGRWVLPAHDSEVLSWADYVPQETMFWRRNIWEEAGGQIDQSFQFAVDWDLILRFREAGARFARVPRFLGAFRIHSNQKTSAQMADIGEREMWRLRDRCHGRRVEYPEVNSEIRGYLRRHVVVHNLYRFGLLRY